jgi:hypothetical protein
MDKITAIIMAIMMVLMGITNANLTDGNWTTTNTLTIPTTPQVGEGCYLHGEEWDSLGSWEEIHGSLQISGIMRVHDIPAGYHVCCPHLFEL